MASDVTYIQFDPKVTWANVCIALVTVTTCVFSVGTLWSDQRYINLQQKTLSTQIENLQIQQNQSKAETERNLDRRFEEVNSAIKTLANRVDRAFERK